MKDRAKEMFDAEMLLMWEWRCRVALLLKKYFYREGTIPNMRLRGTFISQS